MSKQEMYFNLSTAEFQAVCEAANKYDKTMGEALAMLIAKGLESIRNEPLEDSKNVNPYIIENELI